ncbi:MAG: DNRLRE domain-containing protein [Planctomycetales bacterium]|nr:DNRLRE domain-containing protein [Planctomycetales bacterium]MCA9166826.1 DNRLRE domain-containing protein [Planctomycetales bacterium]
MRRKIQLYILLLTFGTFIGFVSSASAQTYKIQPDEAASKDVFTYEFGNPGLFGISTPPRTTNLDTATLATENPDSPLGILLATSKSNLETSSDPNTAHAANTWIGFDVSQLPVTGAEVASAELYLYVIDGEALVASVLGRPAFGNPSPQSSLPTSIYTPVAAWDEQTITWENEPEEAMKLDTVNIEAVESWVSWDVTEAVRGWLDGEANLGLFLDQEEVVASPIAMTNVAAALYASSAFEDATVRPYLAVTVVPEPTALSLASLAMGALAAVARRKR